MKEYSGYILIIAFLIFIVLVFYMLDQLYIPRTVSAVIDFRIKKGESVDSVLKRLEESGLINNKFLVKNFIIFKGIQVKIKPGLYTIGPQYSVDGIFSEFTRGADVEVRVGEGWTNREIAKTLEAKGIVNGASEFYNLSKNFDNSKGKYKFLPQSRKVDLEGFLFPDTYKFERLEIEGYEISGIIEKFLDNFEKKVYSRYGDLSVEELNNSIIMASLVEKEVQTEEDMRLISGILWKRFEAGMPLQVDATLVYIKCSIRIAQPRPSASDIRMLKRFHALSAGNLRLVPSEYNTDDCRKLTAQDKSIESPYNTYEFNGLPPGAISNSGLKAITAAVNPLESPYWYYLSAKDDGRTIFAKTLEEHNQNKEIYR